MKLRRIYKRDKDGQFARVNTLLGAAADAATKKRLKSNSQRSNRLPTKGDRPSTKRPYIQPQILDAAAGKLSLAEGPAREIAKKHDLSGHNRSEANKAAYRECAKYARELKAKYGADAPTADRIYSAAKLIQRGGDIGAKIRQEEGGGGAPNPPQPKPSGGMNTGKKLKLVTIDKLEGLNTKDLIDQYNLADQSDRPRIKDAALLQLKARANSGDKDAMEWLTKDPNGPKMPSISLSEINKRIARAQKMLKSSPTTEEKKIYQDRIDNYKKMINDRLDSATRDQLWSDLKEAQRELVNARRDAKVYRTRAKQYPNNQSYKTMAADADLEVQIHLGTVNRIKAKLNGKDQQTDTPDAKKSKAIPRTDITDPPEARYRREESVVNLFDNWFAAYVYKLDRSTNSSEWKKKLREDKEFRDLTLAKYADILRNPAPLQNTDYAYTYRDMTERNGYNDITQQERHALANSDMKLLRDWLDPQVQADRIEVGYQKWLETSDAAYDLANNFDYDNSSLYEIYMDNDRLRNAIRSEYIDITGISKAYQDKMRAEKFDGVAVAKQPRPPKPQDARKIEPTPYRAKNNTVAELRRELMSREKEFAYGVTRIFGNADFNKLTKEQQDAERAKYMATMDDISALKDKINKMGADRSRSISSATSFDDLFDIFSNRNPGIKSLSGWHEPDGDLAKAMESGGVYSEAHKKIILQRSVRALEAAEAMHDMYPDVPFDGLNARSPSNFRNNRAIAHCSRGKWINIEMNTKFIVDDSPAPGGDPTGFHPPGFAKDPYYNVMVHEFGHSMDWFAFSVHDLSNDDALITRNNGKGIPDNKIYQTAYEEIFANRDNELKNIMTDLFVKLRGDGLVPVSMSYRAFYEKNTSGYARENYHELIAESWQDYHSNGIDKASPISVAVVEHVLQTYRNRVREGKSKPYVIKQAN